MDLDASGMAPVFGCSLQQCAPLPGLRAAEYPQGSTTAAPEHQQELTQQLLTHFLSRSA